MADQKLSALTTGSAIADTDLLYSGQDAGGGVFNSVRQPASALRSYINARQLLTGTRTYYVRQADGNDANSGLVNSAGGAFQTLQRAYNVAATFDTAGFTITIQAGIIGETFTAGIAAGTSCVGGAGINVDLNGGTISTSGTCVSVTTTLLTYLLIMNGTLTSSTGHCMANIGGGFLYVGPSLIFGSAAGAHMQAAGPAAQTSFLFAYTINGSAAYHFYTTANGLITGSALANSYTANLTFTQFALATNIGLIQVPTCSWTSSPPATFTVTGQRYLSVQGAWIDTASGASATFFPGNSAGTGNYS